MAEQGEDWAVADACHSWVNTLASVSGQAAWSEQVDLTWVPWLWSTLQSLLSPWYRDKPTVVHQMSDGLSSSGTETETV